VITINLKQDLKPLFRASAKQPEIVSVPTLHYLMIDGQGDPNTAQSYKDAVEALYSTAYKLRFALKARGIDCPVMPLEGLWWVEDIADFSYDDKSNWFWTMLIMQPEVVSQADFEQAVSAVKAAKKLPALDQLRLGELSEGQAVQIMHLGSYADEPPTVARLHQYIADQNLTVTGKHHEIYLSDARRVAPEKLKTIIRYPIRPKS